MAATASFPSGYNTFIPDLAASGNMVVDFSRNPSTFKLPKYVQYKKSGKNVGRYVEMTVEQAGRVLDTSGADAYWADGQERPSNRGEVESFLFKEYRTIRRERGFAMGNLAADQAAWDIVAQHARITAQRMMTLRTQLCATELLTSGNYSTVVTDVTTITGVTGKLDVSTDTRSDIKRCFDYAADVIRKATLGAVLPSQIQFVMSPGTARLLAATQEIRSYIKYSDNAEKYVTGNLGPLNNYGLPETLYGYGVVVEDAVKVTNKKGATKATSYVFSDDYIAACSNVGDLDGLDEAPTFSTWTAFFNEELTVETLDDPNNRRKRGSVVDDFVLKMTAPAAAVLFTDVLT